MTGFSLIPGAAAAELASPASTHIRLLAHQQQAQAAAGSDAALRSAIVNVAHYYLRMAQSKTPAEMEAVIWQHDSIDGVDHGESCAAFASLTLEQAAQVVGQHSWVRGGTSYPWPLHQWVDARVDPNPASLSITSVLQDARAHHRWHPVGDGYRPMPGDWVLFDGHVEVVTGYEGGVLHTIGGDSLPNFSVNAHQYPAPLPAEGVAGFVNNGGLTVTAKRAPGSDARVAAAGTSPRHGHDHQPRRGQAAIPGIPGPGSAVGASGSAGGGPVAAATAGHGARPGEHAPRRGPRPGHEAKSPGGHGSGQATLDEAAAAEVPGTGVAGLVATVQAAHRGAASIPGVTTTAHRRPGAGRTAPARPYRRHQPPPAVSAPGTSQAQQAFITEIARAAMATQRQYGVPASVTIAQAIEESGWGSSELATRDHNLFGIKGSGPAGSDVLPTQEVYNGQTVTISAPFRVYHSIAQSIEDHARLLATTAPYQHSMALTHDPNAFASSLTGVYATDPNYGDALISIMHRYGLYRYDAAGHPAPSQGAAPAPSRRPAASRSSAPATSAPATSAPRPAAPSSAGPAPSPPAPTAPAPTLAPPAPASAAPAPTSAAPTNTTTTAPTTTAPRTAPRRGTPAKRGTAQRTTGPATPSSAAVPGGPGPRASGAHTGRRGGGTPSTPDIPGASAPAVVQASGASRLTRGHTAAAAVAGPSGLHRSSARVTRTTHTTSGMRMPAATHGHPRTITAHTTAAITTRYQAHLPPPVKNAFMTAARGPLSRAEPLYRDVAADVGIGWELLAACDWMQCRAHPRFSPVHGEKLGTVNAGGTAYRTKSAALEQCARDLLALARAVYGIDLTARGHLSVRDLASAFAAFRWGALLKVHHTSAMEFPYSVEGLTVQHVHMRWPNIDARHAPDKPGARFRMPFGAVPVVLSLAYPATV